MCTVTMRPAFRATGLRISMAGALLLWLFLLYGRSLYQITPVELRSLWRLLGPLALTVDFLNPLFHSPTVFVGSYLLGVASIVWLATGQVRQSVWRLSFVACGVLALLFPLTLPMTYGEYHLPVGSAPGHPWWWITQPSNLYSSAFKQAQHFGKSFFPGRTVGGSSRQVVLWPKRYRSGGPRKIGPISPPNNGSSRRRSRGGARSAKGHILQSSQPKPRPTIACRRPLRCSFDFAALRSGCSLPPPASLLLRLRCAPLRMQLAGG